MLMTAAGTISPARVFIMGAGVAGLQAISTARRLGAKVEAYDVRPAVKEQVQSLGAGSSSCHSRPGTPRTKADMPRRRTNLLQASARDDVEGRRGQRRRHHDRARPGQAAPILVTTEMVEAMAPDR